MRAMLIAATRLPAHDPVFLAWLGFLGEFLLFALFDRAAAGLRALALLLLLLLPKLAPAVGFVALQVRGGESNGCRRAAKHDEANWNLISKLDSKWMRAEMMAWLN